MRTTPAALGMTRFRCEAGLLVEEWELFDRMGLLAQLE